MVSDSPHFRETQLGNSVVESGGDRGSERPSSRIAELEASLEKLENSNRDLEQFAYVASHDLQTPLRNVEQGLELLNLHLQETLGAGFDAEAEDIRTQIMGSIVGMKALISGLLTYSSVRQQQGEHATVDLDALAKNVVAELGTDLGTVGASVRIHSLPTVNGNAVLLRQLMQNLIGNAFKYRSEERKMQIDITSEEQNEMWLVCVADNGIGLEPFENETIFELFKRGDSNRTGAGIGLAICKRVVDYHAGQINLESEKDKGTQVFFTLPKAQL